MLLQIKIICGTDSLYSRDTERKNQCDFIIVGITVSRGNSCDTRLKRENMFHSRKISFVIVVFSVSDSSGIDGDMFDGDSSKGICDMDFPVVRLDYGRIREFAVTTFQGKGRVPVFAVPGNGNIEHLSAMGGGMRISLRVVIDQQLPPVGKSYRIGSGVGVGHGRCWDQTPCSSCVGRPALSDYTLTCTTKDL